MNVNNILNDLESMLSLFRNYKELDGDISIPVKCFKEVITTKLNYISKELEDMK